jgi:hypothetical protein
VTRSQTPEAVAEEMTTLANDLNAALASGDLARANTVQRQIARTLSKFNRAMADTAAGAPTAPAPGPTQREMVISIAAAIGQATPTRLIRDLAEVDGTPIKSTGFPSIFRADQRSWRSNPGKKPVLVLPALEASTAAPMQSWVTLSTFDLGHRIVTPLTPRAAHLRSLIYVLDRLEQTPDAGTSDQFSNLVRRLASALPETRIFDTSDLDALRTRCEEALAAVETAETSQRAESVARLKDATTEMTLFGFRNLEVHTGGAEAR